VRAAALEDFGADFGAGELLHVSSVIGDAIGTFVLVFCSLNWYYYRQENQKRKR
jgi:hypothetical protein